MLNNPFGVFFYLILRNDWAWKLLSESEQQMILGVNRSFNVEREDYANPELYGTGRVDGGENWDSTVRRDNTLRGRFLLKAIEKMRPQSVLEIGPGPGYFSRPICEFPSVELYTAIELGSGFLHYLRPRLEAMKLNRPEFSYMLLQGTVEEQNVERADFILVLSCVHHIPNRVDFFRELSLRLKEGGSIFCFDPSHYPSRWARLIIACVKSGYLKKSSYLKRENLSTHSFCTLGEYKAILNELPELELAEEYYVPAKKAGKIPFLTKIFPRFTSIEMGVLLTKKKARTTSN